MFWKRERRDQVAGVGQGQPAPAAERDWTAELAELRADLDRIGVERATLTAEAGRALLDADHARGEEIEAMLASLDHGERAIRAAIVLAEERQASADREAAARLRADMVAEYRSLVADWLDAHAAVRAAEAALEGAIKARRSSIDLDRLDGLQTQLIGEHVSVPDLRVLADQCSSAESARKRAVELRQEAERYAGASIPTSLQNRAARERQVTDARKRLDRLRTEAQRQDREQTVHPADLAAAEQRLAEAERVARAEVTP